MKQAFSLAVLAGIACALAGCSRPSGGMGHRIAYSTDHSHDPPSTPGKYGGRLNFVNISDPKTFNVWVSDETASQDVLNPIIDFLNTRDAFTLKFVPRLADLPKISADGRTYTYTLRPGLKWSDGVPLTADDVLFTLDVINNPKTEGLLREGLEVDVTGPDGKSKRVPFGYHKLDSRTVQFVLPAKYSPAESMFSSFPIAPRHALEAAYKSGQFNSTWGVNTPVSHLISCGPFVISEYAAGQRVVYKPNPYFWHRSVDNKPLPYLSDYNYLIVSDLGSMTLKFRSGESDMLGLLPLADYPSVSRGADAGNYTVIDRGPEWGFNYLCFNMNPNSKMGKENPALLSVFQDVRFRQAVSYAVNRQRICDDIFLGLAKPMYGPVSPADTQFFDPNIKQYPYDLNKARQLLTEMGLKDKDSSGYFTYRGHEVKFNIVTNSENEQRKAMATIITEDLKKIGLNATFTPITFNDLIRRVDNPPYDWEGCILGFLGDPEPHSNSNIWRSSGPDHQWRPKQTTPATPWEAQIDALYIQGDHEMDLAKRKKIYDQWQEIAAEQQPFIFTVVRNQYSAVHNHFGNIKPSSLYGNSGEVTWNLAEIYDTNASRMTP